MTDSLKLSIRRMLKGSLRHHIYLAKVQTDPLYEGWAFTADLYELSLKELLGELRDKGIEDSEVQSLLRESLPEVLATIKASYEEIGVSIEEELARYEADFDPATILKHGAAL